MHKVSLLLAQDVASEDLLVVYLWKFTLHLTAAACILIVPDFSVVWLEVKLRQCLAKLLHQVLV